MSRTAQSAHTGVLDHHPDSSIDLLREAIGTLANAADHGPQALFSEARILFRNLLAAKDVRLLVRSAGTWREWEKLNDGADEALIESLPDAPVGVVHFDDSVFIPVQVGSVALLVEGTSNPTALRDTATILSMVFGLANRIKRKSEGQSRQTRSYPRIPTRRKQDPEESEPSGSFSSNHS